MGDATSSKVASNSPPTHSGTGGGSGQGGANKQGEMKLVLIGREGVGKSCLMMQYISHCFEENHLPTLEDATFTQRVVDGASWRLQIIDTAGQEHFQTLMEQYYQSGHGFLAVFDLCNRQSLLELQAMFTRVARSKDLLDSADPLHHHVPCVIVGNKLDLPPKQVTDEEVEAFKKQFNFPYFETSAKTRHNVEEAFEKLIQETAKKIFFKRSIPNDQSSHDRSRGKAGQGYDGRKKKKSGGGMSDKNGGRCVIS